MDRVPPGSGRSPPTTPSPKCQPIVTLSVTIGEDFGVAGDGSGVGAVGTGARMDDHTLPHPQAGPGVVELAGLLAPGATVTETSHPAPALEHWNVAVLLDDASTARDAVVTLESLTADDAAIGFTVLSPATSTAPTSEGRAARRAGVEVGRADTTDTADTMGGLVHPEGRRDDRHGTVRDGMVLEGVDREGVVGDVAPRAVVGGAIGGVVGALIVGIAGWLFADGTGAIAGAIGGFLLGAPIGAIWGSFARMGGSDAYRQTFVDPGDPSTFMVSLHTADAERADEAAERLGGLGIVVRAEFDGDHLRVA